MSILIVDDSNFVRQFIKKYLLEIVPDAQLYFAGSGEEGYQVYLDEKPDMIITDLLMPGMGGQAFVQAVRETDSATKIVVLSADIQKTVKEEIKSLQVSAFLNKPITRENILAISDIIRG